MTAARSLMSGAYKADPTWKRWQRAMGSSGLESWVIIPAERVTARTRLIRERSWIRRMGKTYNCKRPWGKGRAQALGQRALRDEGPGNMDDLTAQAEKVAHALRVPESAAQLVRLLLACRKRVPKNVESKLYQKVKDVIRQRLGIHLPRVLALPIPTGKDVDMQPTMDALRTILTEFAAPKWLHRYLTAVIRPVGKRGKKLKDVLAPTTLRGSMEEALAKSEATVRTVPRGCRECMHAASRGTRRTFVCSSGITRLCLCKISITPRRQTGALPQKLSTDLLSNYPDPSAEGRDLPSV